MEDENKKTEQPQGFTYEKAGDSNGEARREAEPYTFGPFGRSERSYEGESVKEESVGIVEAAPGAREYRPFTVSGGPAKNDWGAKPPRRTSFRAIFASFLAGVIVVGALMYAADRQNWFTGELFGQSPQTQETTVKPVSNPVGNNEDVVRPNNIAKIFEQASPAVVKVETYAKSRQGMTWEDEFFRQFFGDNYRGNRSGEGGGELQESGMGSGFLFDSTGYILTNQHVIDGADEIKVTVEGHEEPYTAKLLGSSSELDLAVLKIEGSDFPTLKLGDSSSMNMGDWVVAIGNPVGFEHTITVGVLSSNEREITIQDGNGTRKYQHLLQTDASINPGNSGGPLLNLNGEVIGINTAVSTQAQGIGFAIPTSTITEVLENLKSNTKIPQKPVPFIGATLMDVNEEIAQQLGIDKDTKGSFVREVIFNSPAYRGDLRQYDVITGMDGTAYKNKDELIAAIQKKEIGAKVTLDVLRGEKKLEIFVEIGDKNEFNVQQ
ncbi:S1C family serine protease [Cohnella hongkongensis]|uniref:S1C family serine protease n=1 Tax=Cohnella hongkongensis TaxID=178337 RepID=A0ABV9FCD7_9BACL